MQCKRCKEIGVLNSANYKEFWYCRQCKEEIYPDPFLDPKVQAEYDNWLDNVKKSYDAADFKVTTKNDVYADLDDYDPGEDNDDDDYYCGGSACLKC